MTKGAIVLLTFQLTKPNTGEPLPNRYIDVRTDLVRSIELIGPTIHLNDEPLPTSSHRFRFTFTNGDELYLYAAPADEADMADARMNGLREVLRGNKSVRIDVFRSDKDADRQSSPAE